MTKLTKEQKDFILEELQTGFETGHPICDEDELRDVLKDEGDLFKGKIKVAVDWYFELLELGPSGFYAEYPNLNWDRDFVSEFGY